jgi:hypothetical protein
VALRLGFATQSVEDGIPTPSVGTRFPVVSSDRSDCRPGDATTVSDYFVLFRIKLNLSSPDCAVLRGKRLK